MFVHTVIMVIEPHMKQGRQHKLISTIFLATSVTKKLDHNKSPLDAISLYELTKEPGIYIALSSLDPKNLDYAIHSFPTENLVLRPVILALSQTPTTDVFCSNLPHQRILPTGNSWSEDLRKIHRSPMSMREVDDGDNSFVCALLDSKGNVTSYSTYQDSKNVKLIDIKIPTYG